MEKEIKRTVLKAGRLVDGTGVASKANVAILVEDGKIKEIGDPLQVGSPPDAEVVDLGGATVMPGLVDAHMHFFGVPSNELWRLPTGPEPLRALRAAGEARRMFKSGITACRCCGSSVSPYLRQAINEGYVPGPRIVAAGEFICSTTGTWDHLSMPVSVVKAGDMLADGVEACREIIRRRIRQGATVIKVGLSKGGVNDKYHAWGDDPYEQVAAYSPEEILALTDEAHRNKLKVSAHCIGDAAVRAALAGGIDTIEHAYGITDDTRTALVDRNALVVSTISQLYFHLAAAEPFHYPAWERAVYDRHIAVMRTDFEKNLRAGVRYALGTDLIGYPTHPQDHAAKEFELAVEWGMEPMQAIVAGTKVSAEALGMEKLIGTVEVGKFADLIACSGDPEKDITLLQHVGFVMHGGNVIVDKMSSRVPATAT